MKSLLCANVQGTRDRVNQTDQVSDFRELKFRGGGGEGTRKLPIMLHATKR